MSLQGFSGIDGGVLLGHIWHHLECSPGAPNAIDHITLTAACHGLQEQNTTSILPVVPWQVQYFNVQ